VAEDLCRVFGRGFCLGVVVGLDAAAHGMVAAAERVFTFWDVFVAWVLGFDLGAVASWMTVVVLESWFVVAWF
jgi:hypothetical protein